MRRAESLRPCRQSAVRMPGACDGRRAKNRRIEKEIVMALIIQVTDFSDPALTPYARLRETQLEHYYEPHGGLFIAESPKVIERALGAGYEPVSILAERRQQESEWETREIISRCGEIPVYTAEYELLTRITGFTLTKGLLCAMRRRPLPPVDQILAKASRIAVLEKVVNPTNIGAIFRSAAALGMDAVLLTPGLQRSAVPAGDPGQHGNGLSDPMDDFPQRVRLARTRACAFKTPRLFDGGHGVEGEVVKH